MTGLTTTRARAWALTRRDGVSFGFTDHDRDLGFDGICFRADTGMTAKALTQTTGLALDNTEAAGALSSDGLTEADILAGRYDAADLRIWDVDWTNVEDRNLLFRGTLGEITRAGGAFRVELCGLSEPLSRSGGRVFGALCPSVLGDAKCGFQSSSSGYSFRARIVDVKEAGAALHLAAVASYTGGWFAQGRVHFLDGPASGLEALVRRDLATDHGRRLELWTAPGALPSPGDEVRVEAGCDKRFETCRKKFRNQTNFRGFPHVPSEDWLALVPREGGSNHGGRRR